MSKEELPIEVSGVQIVDANSLLARWSEMFNADLKDIMTNTGAFKPLSEWPRVWRQMLSGVEVNELYERSRDGGNASWDKVGEVVKLRWISMKDLGELLAKHKSVDAFVSQKHVDVNIGVVTAERAREVAAAHRRLEAALQQERKMIELESFDLLKEGELPR